MAAINYERLLRDYRLVEADYAAGCRRTDGRQLVEEMFRERLVRPRDFHFGELFEAAYGTHHFKACRAKKALATEVMARSLLEAEGAVTTAAFQNISGQIVYSEVMEASESEDFVFSKLIPEQPITNGTLEGEKIAGITEIGDEIAVRNENEEYALAGVGEDWIFAPRSVDRGLIVPVTWEAIFADRTGKVLERAGDVGKWFGQNKEKRAIDCVVDENTTAHRYNWRGTVIASYGDNSGSHTWDNLAASNALVDWTDLDAAEQVFNGLVDPYTGEPIVIEPKHLIFTKQLEQTAWHILNSTMIKRTTPGYATSANPNQNEIKNPYSQKYTPVTSRLLAARMATDTTWFLGDVGAYARYRVAEKMNVQQAPPNSEAEFRRRIVQQYRVNEHGAFYVRQPRAIVQCTA